MFWTRRPRSKSPCTMDSTSGCRTPATSMTRARRHWSARTPRRSRRPSWSRRRLPTGAGSVNAPTYVGCCPTTKMPRPMRWPDCTRRRPRRWARAHVCSGPSGRADSWSRSGTSTPAWPAPTTRTPWRRWSFASMRHWRKAVPERAGTAGPFGPAESPGHPALRPDAMDPLTPLTSVAAIIAAKNEAARIAATVSAVRRIDRVDLVIVVDDGSSDATARLAGEAGAVVISHPRNRGKAAAMATGARAAADLDLREPLDSGRGRELLFIDADLGDSAANMAVLIGPVASGEADMTIAVLPPQETAGGGHGFVVRLARNGIPV